jgi:hypothetical protein
MNSFTFLFKAIKEKHKQHKTNIDIDELISRTTNICQIILTKQLILVFFAFFSILVALAQNTTGITSCCRQKWPRSIPHEVLHSSSTHQIDGGQPSKLVDIFWGGVEGVYDPQSAPLFRR